MELTLQTLQEAGAFTPAQPVKQEISWVNDKGETVTCDTYIRLKSYATVVQESLHHNQGIDAVAAKIAASVVDQNNKTVFSAADIVGSAERGPICSGLTFALLGAISKANGVGESADPKSLVPTKNSGQTLSSPESAAEQSTKPSET
ncbi:phage tail assembly chaperone family protein, TAC [Rheinheimera sp. MM224]|uniref:phage tail assembly chaperone family protein, TAC n=1 Tax=Rheinheimera sp. MM224 TaxID=3019969 RepID=UPI0021F90A7E|nr:phage tail assembly chaperone family protein, TAC [Rheinheimera sp. MM224]CAI3796040.1 hypothetical protein JAMGFMIE_01468 [Rheinheimera sp. MM224]